MTVAHRLNISRSRVLIVAGAGYGKSAFLEAHRPAAGVVRSAYELRDRGLPPGVPWVGVDGFDELGTHDQAQVIQALATAPDLGYAITSRTPICAQVRGGLRVQVYDRGPGDLALAAHPMAVLLAEEYSVTDPEAAVAVRDLTAGWPALVHFAGDALRRDPGVDLTAALSEPGSAAAIWVGSNVLGALGPEVLHVLGVLAGLGPVGQELCERVATASGLDAARVAGAAELLAQTGLLVPRRRASRSEELVVVPAIAEILARRATDGPAAAGVLRAVARAYEAGSQWLAAAGAHHRAGDAHEVARLVEREGKDMIRGGDAPGVARLLARLDDAGWSEELRLIHANALRCSADPGGARRALEPLVRQAEQAGWDYRLATSVASVHYMLGDFGPALEVLDRVGRSGGGVPGVGAGPAVGAGPGAGEPVEWLVCRVNVVAMLGRHEEAAAVAARALELAERSGSPADLGQAQLAMARTCTGARKEAHYEAALREATRAGDAITAARVLAGRTHLLLTSARYAEACVVAREAVRMAELSSPTGLLAVALHNLGEALTRVGEFAESRWYLQRSIAVCRRLGPGRTAMGLLGIAEIHRELGHEEQGRAAYLEAVGLARGTNDLQVLVPALAGLARLMTGPSAGPSTGRLAGPSDGAALCLATEAEQVATPALLPVAQVARGWVAVAHGDRVEAAEQAARAVASARVAQGVDILAEALELSAESSDDPTAARLALTEALSIWREGGAAPAVARVEVMLGRLPGADGMDRSRAREAGRYLQRLGILRVNGRPVTEDRGAAAVVIQVLGPFRVSVDGSEVALPAWRSRQARTLVKILAARRGRVLTRAHLCELVWPDDDPARTGHRLSVLLATVRGVLDPDKAWPPDRYIVADQTGIRLDLTHVALDADALIRDAAHAAELGDAGDARDTDRAREILTSIDERYRGDAFEDEPDQEWADGLREEVRSAWVRSVRRLASLHSRAGRGGEALGLLLRLLLVDPYDEQVHRRLVTSLSRAGRHGEARRAFERWVEAMRSIDAPAPDPLILATARGTTSPTRA